MREERDPEDNGPSTDLLFGRYGTLECYPGESNRNGLVLENYHGIIDLICQPLDIVEAPRDVAQLSLKRKSQEKSSLYTNLIAHLTQLTTYAPSLKKMYEERGSIQLL